NCSPLLLSPYFCFFFFTVPAPPAIYTLSLHDALPICASACACPRGRLCTPSAGDSRPRARHPAARARPSRTHTRPRRDRARPRRSEEHTSELQSRSDLVCRLLLEKKKKKTE